MSFIQTSDYQAQFTAAQWQVFQQNDVTATETAHAEARALLRQALRTHYDAASILAKTGNERDILLLLHAKRIVVYLLHQRLPNVAMPTHIAADYAQTTQFLNDLESEKRIVDLPLRPDLLDPSLANVDAATSRFRWGSQPLNR
jgi:hypothetical protein